MAERRSSELWGTGLAPAGSISANRARLPSAKPFLLDCTMPGHRSLSLETSDLTVRTEQPSSAARADDVVQPSLVARCRKRRRSLSMVSSRTSTLQSTAIKVPPRRPASSVDRCTVTVQRSDWKVQRQRRSVYVSKANGTTRGRHGERAAASAGDGHHRPCRRR